MITASQFAAMIPTNKNPDQWYTVAMQMFRKYDIETPNRIAGFMSQGGHESGDFRVLQENLNYSADGLLKTFPRYFNRQMASAFARKPEQIANRVYDDANRTPTGKLGNVNPGDGWRFRGRGIFQLTGRNNYTAFGASIGMSAEEAAAYCETLQGAMESACWFWKTRRLERFADAGDIVGLSRAVNGGTNGLADRQQRWNSALRLMRNASAPVSESDKSMLPKEKTLGRGSRGQVVRDVQAALKRAVDPKIAVDGSFGPNTERAVATWQRNNNFPDNGVLTETQARQLLGFIK